MKNAGDCGYKKGVPQALYHIASHSTSVSLRISKFRTPKFPIGICSVTLDPILAATMTGKDTQELDARAAAGETVVPGGTGGKSLEAQQHLAEGRSKGGQARAEQLGHEGYVEMGKKGGSATNDMPGGEAAEAAGREIDESKFSNQ